MKMNGCTPWMKKKVLYTSGMVGNKTNHIYRQFCYNGVISCAILMKLGLNCKSGIQDRYRFLKSRVVIDFKNLGLI